MTTQMSDEEMKVIDKVCTTIGMDYIGSAFVDAIKEYGLELSDQESNELLYKMCSRYDERRNPEDFLYIAKQAASEYSKSR